MVAPVSAEPRKVNVPWWALFRSIKYGNYNSLGHRTGVGGRRRARQVHTSSRVAEMLMGDRRGRMGVPPVVRHRHRGVHCQCVSVRLPALDV